MRRARSAHGKRVLSLALAALIKAALDGWHRRRCPRLRQSYRRNHQAHLVRVQPVDGPVLGPLIKSEADHSTQILDSLDEDVGLVLGDSEINRQWEDYGLANLESK